MLNKIEISILLIEFCSRLLKKMKKKSDKNCIVLSNEMNENIFDKVFFY